MSEIWQKNVQRSNVTWHENVKMTNVAWMLQQEPGWKQL
jgi:hypothetical protein